MLLGMFKFSVMELLVIQLNFCISYFSVRKKISKENKVLSVKDNFCALLCLPKVTNMLLLFFFEKCPYEMKFETSDLPSR